MEFVESKHSFYRPIYILSLVDLKSLKIYIKTYLKAGFIQPAKIFINASIFFDPKSNKKLYL